MNENRLRNGLVIGLTFCDVVDNGNVDQMVEEMVAEVDKKAVARDIGGDYVDDTAYGEAEEMECDDEADNNEDVVDDMDSLADRHALADKDTEDGGEDNVVEDIEVDSLGGLLDDQFFHLVFHYVLVDHVLVDYEQLQLVQLR